jgi:TRAP-type C4-dicarboxylate transport system permease small subunit
VSFLTIERVATHWTRHLALFGGWLLLAVAIVTASDALLRDFLGRPLPGTFEATELVLAAIIFFGLPYTSLTDGHVSVDFLTGRLGQRAQHAIIAVNALICAGLFGVITLQMTALAAKFLATQRTTITMRIPIFPCIVPVTVTAGLAALAFVVQAIGAARRAWRLSLPPLPTPHR